MGLCIVKFISRVDNSGVLVEINFIYFFIVKFINGLLRKFFVIIIVLLKIFVRIEILFFV